MTLEDVAISRPDRSPDSPGSGQSLKRHPELVDHLYSGPDYSKNFRCLAEACDENCCSGWTIPIDQRTHEEYLAHPVLKPFAQKLVVINPHPTPADVARMPLDHQGTCAFLNQEQLCGIQAHFGPSLLPDACANYPRERGEIAGHFETTLNLSCPEAARLTLLNPLLRGSGPWQIFGPRRYSQMLHATRLSNDFNPLIALRELTLLLISDPTYLLWQRLHLLGELTERLELLTEGKETRHWVLKHPAAVASLIDEFTDTAAFHTLSFPKLTPNPTLQLRFTAEILRNRLSEPPVPVRFLRIVQDFQAGLNCTTGGREMLTDNQIAENFSSAYRFYARPLLDRHPHLVENYLTNHIFKYAYPFGREDAGSSGSSPREQHLALVAHLALTQTLLVGLAAYHRDQLSPDHIVRLIQSLSKTIEHRPRSAAHLVELMPQQHLVTPSAQAQLLHLA